MATALEFDIESLVKSMTDLRLDVGHHFYAVPTYVEHPHNFYLIPYQYRTYLPYLNEAGRPYWAREIKENDIVIFRSQRPDVNKYLKPFVKNMVRGTIHTVKEDGTCMLHSMDLGFFEDNVPVDYIFHPVHKETFELPPLVQHCELDLCCPKGGSFDSEAIKSFLYFLGNEKLSVVVKGIWMDKLKVVIYNSNPDDIATLLAMTHFTYLANISGPYKPGPIGPVRKLYHVQNPIHHHSHKIGDTFEVRVQSGTNLDSFYVSTLKNYKTYVDNRAAFYEYCKLQPEIEEENLKIGFSVGVEDDRSGFYERSVILSVDDAKDQAMVRYVDWGTEKIVPKQKIRYIKSQVYTMEPAAALYCKVVEGFKPWNTGLPQFLYKGYTFNVTVKKLGHKFENPHIVLPTQSKK